jgi:SHS2 domain-containing protein
MDASGPASWEHFPHGADIGVRGIGPTPAAAFVGIARAVTAVVVNPAVLAGDQADQTGEPSVTLECEAANLDELLYDWIDALVFEMSTRRMLFGRVEVEIDDLHLRARLWGTPVDRVRHEPAVEVKGPTYTELGVTRDPALAGSRWIAQCVVDV